jgi:hypothetical protein
MQQYPFAFWVIIGMSLMSVFGVMIFWKYKRL